MPYEDSMLAYMTYKHRYLRRCCVFKVMSVISKAGLNQNLEHVQVTDVVRVSAQSSRCGKRLQASQAVEIWSVTKNTLTCCVSDSVSLHQYSR